MKVVQARKDRAWGAVIRAGVAGTPLPFPCLPQLSPGGPSTLSPTSSPAYQGQIHLPDGAPGRGGGASQVRVGRV